MRYLENCKCGKDAYHMEEWYSQLGRRYLYYCDKCYEKRQERKILEEKWRTEKREKEQLKAQKQARYEYLKREVELAELELRAKELGVE